MPLSDAKVRSLQSAEKPYKVADFDGLFILVKVSGSKSWRFKYRIASQEKLLVIGDYPSITLAQARQARDAARALVANCEDPSEVKQWKAIQEAEGKPQTFERVAGQYLAKLKKEGRAAATLEKYEWILGMVNPDIGHKPIAQITAPMILKCLRKVEAKGNDETARRMRSTISSIFRFAIATGVAENDPTFALRGALIQHKTTPRAAIIDPVALGGPMRAIDGFQGQTATRIGLELLALTACRPGELRWATWAEFDIDAGIWLIPGARMKMRRPHRVPLPAHALSLIERLRPLTGNSAFLLPSLRTPKEPMSENTLNGQHDASAVGGVCDQPFWCDAEGIIYLVDHCLHRSDLGLSDRPGGFHIEDDAVVGVDQMVGGIGKIGGSAASPGPLRGGIGMRRELLGSLRRRPHRQAFPDTP